MTISKKLSFIMLLTKTDAVVSRKLGGQGLSLGDLAVLHAIHSSPEGKIRRVDLAEQVGLTASGVTRLLIPLEKIGVIKREANDHDGRVSYTMLTKSGKELFEDSMKWLELKCSDLLSGTTDKALTDATALLSKISQ